MNRQEKVEQWMRPNLRDLKPYYKAPLQGEPLRLDQNTNLAGANPALASVDPASLDMTQYPSRDSDLLMQALADWHGLEPENFLASNGSDESLDILTKGFTTPGAALATPWPGYSLYPFYAKLQDLNMRRVPLTSKFTLDVDGLLADKPAMVLVANPNNPTGNRFQESDLQRLIEEAPGIVVVDEAYIEYAGLRNSWLPRVEEFDNLVVMRTFSKAYGLAAMRIGYLTANTELMARLRVVKPPFNLNLFAEHVAVQALEGQEWVDAGVRDVMAERENLAAALKARGFKPYPSDANFILCRSPLPPPQVVAELRSRGILIRHFPDAPMLEETVRFTVGLPEHQARLLQALDEVLA